MCPLPHAQYLYVSHADGDLASELWALSKAHSSKNGHEMARVAQPLVADTALAALITPYPNLPLGARREPPSDRLHPVCNNTVASAVIRLPHPPRHHLSVLLAGAQTAPTLHPRELPRPSAEEGEFMRMLHA